MRRRAFISLIGGGVATWPLVARSQQAAVPVVGFLNPTTPETSLDRVRAFRQGLKETGHVEGENVAIEYRFAENQINRLPALAADLVRRRVAVLAAVGAEAPIRAAMAATSTIPIVFIAGDDPVRTGLVTSLARPGGNLTGVNFLTLELVAKRLELLRELVPGAARIAVIVNPANSAGAETTSRDVTTAARDFGLQLRIFNASTSAEIDAAFANMAGDRSDALFVAADPFFSSRRVQLVLLAAHHSIPAIFAGRETAEAGGLMSYGANIADMYRQVGVYAGRILKGAKPADMPVLQATKFELIINAQTARLLRLKVPQSLQVAADEVIE
jgi:putative ABC transport system substrate-binding protein